MTFKHKKQELSRQGFDLATISNPVYFDGAATQACVRLDTVLYQNAGKIGVSVSATRRHNDWMPR